MKKKDFEIIRSAAHIKELRNEKGLSQKELGEQLGFDRSLVTKYESGRVSQSAEFARKMSDMFGVSIDYILGKTEERNFDVTRLSNYTGKAEKFLRVPVIGTVKCGPNGFAYQYLDGMETLPDDGSHSDIVAFRCRGDSMTGLGIFEGDIAFVHIQPEVESGELAVVAVDGEEGMLKRVIRHGDTLLLESANAAYPTRVFTGSEMSTVRIVGKVLWVKKTF